MPTTRAQDNVTVIDTDVALPPLLDSLAKLAVDHPSLYIDLEGIELGCHGSVCIVSLYVAPTKESYLIDTHSIGKAAFSTTTKSGTSLKTILEFSIIPKVIFDVRNDSDAIFSLFQISMDGIKDLHLMELASRIFSKEFVPGLVKCIENDSPVSAAAKTEWHLAKERGRRLFALENGGRHEISMSVL